MKKKMIPLLLGVGASAYAIYKYMTGNKNTPENIAKASMDRAIDCIKKWEGLYSAKPYPVYQKLTSYNSNTIVYAYKNLNDPATIGWGCTYLPNGNKVKTSDKATVAQCEQYMRHLLKPIHDKALLLTQGMGLTYYQIAAICDYCYNRDISRMGAFVNFLKTKPSNTSIRSWLVSNWGQNTTYKNGLINRRNREADLFINNVINSL